MSLEDENSYCHTILSHMAAAVVVIDENHHIHYMNEQAERFFGNKRDLKCYKAFLQSKRPCRNCFVKRSIENRVKRLEVLRRDKKGRFFDTLSSFIQDKDGNPLLIEIFNDVTDRIKLEKEQKRLLRLVEKNRRETQREFIASLKHKINNSLTGLLAVVDYLEHKDKEREMVEGGDPYSLMKEEIDKVRQVLKRLSNLKVIATKEYVNGEMMIDLDLPTNVSFKADGRKA